MKSTRPSRRSLQLLRSGTAGELFNVTWTLRLLNGEKAGEFRVLDENVCVVGAHLGADFPVLDPAVSRYHVELHPQADGLRVHDLGSTNGTFVNGVRIQDALLPVGSATLEIGDSKLSIEVEQARVTATDVAEFGSMSSKSPSMRRAFGQLRKLAESDSTALLVGESGSGKEVMAREIHAQSARASSPMVVIDCASLSNELIGSTLFGHRKGAFTGADSNRLGAFASADKGTLFLDEVAELPLEAQPHVLRALERRVVTPLGSDTPLPIDVRVVAATAVDLESAVREGRFRSDLYYRLAVCVIQVPPLRERTEDLPDLVQKLLEKLQRLDFAVTPQLLTALGAYDWPGNIRELDNVLAQVVLGMTPSQVAGPVGSAQPLTFKEAKEAVIDRFAREYLRTLYKSTNGNITEMARQAGVARTHMHRLIDRFVPQTAKPSSSV